jgi:hypothetical protein
MRLFATCLLTFVLPGPVQAHFIWVIPSAKGDSAEVLWSDDLEPDNMDEKLTTIAEARVVLRRADAGVEELKWKQDGAVYRVACPGEGVRTLAVTWKESGRAGGTLMLYNAKTYLPDRTGKVKDTKTAAWNLLDLEIVPRSDLGADTYQVLFKGRALANPFVRAFATTADLSAAMRRPRTDKEGLFTFTAPTPGVYGFRVLHKTKEPVEHEGKKFAGGWYESTLVIRVPEKREK